MRDAFGGVFTMNLLLVFIVVLTGFAAVSLNYAKAFRIKNGIIDFIEQEQILNLKDYYKKHSTMPKIDDILDRANYNVECTDGNGEIKSKVGGPYAICYNGIIIEQTETKNDVIHYTITTYASWNLGIFNMVLGLAGEDKNSEEPISGVWKITGEAKVVKVI